MSLAHTCHHDQLVLLLWLQTEVNTELYQVRAGIHCGVRDIDNPWWQISHNITHGLVLMVRQTKRQRTQRTKKTRKSVLNQQGDRIVRGQWLFQLKSIHPLIEDISIIRTGSMNLKWICLTWWLHLKIYTLCVRWRDSICNRGTSCKLDYI